MNKKIKQAIWEVVNKINDLNIVDLLTSKLNEYIAIRGLKINDKIYLDVNKLILVKAKHDEEVNKKLKIFESIFKEILFKMGRCDVTAAKTVQREMKKLNEQQAIRDQKSETHIIALEQKIELLMNRIKELESK